MRRGSCSKCEGVCLTVVAMDVSNRRVVTLSVQPSSLFLALFPLQQQKDNGRPFGHPLFVGPEQDQKQARRGFAKNTSFGGEHERKRGCGEEKRAWDCGLEHEVVLGLGGSGQRTGASGERVWMEKGGWATGIETGRGRCEDSVFTVYNYTWQRPKCY